MRLDKRAMRIAKLLWCNVSLAFGHMSYLEDGGSKTDGGLLTDS